LSVPPFREALDALSRYVVGDQALGDTLLRVSQVAQEVLPQAAFAGLTLIREGEPATPVFTDPEAPEIDRSQYETGEGPCLEAYRQAEQFRIDDTRSDDRWPAFAAACVEHGVLSTLSMPLLRNGSAVGALNFYARSAGAFSDAAASDADYFAQTAAAVLANAQDYWGAQEMSENLDTAIRSRAVIEQAKGVLMARSGATSEEAFEVLRRASQRENRKLREIAVEIVQGTSRTAGPADAEGASAPDA
jgi:GAF domain-containing protein